MSKAIDFLKAHESETPSRFMENAQFRKENKTWITWSREVALLIIRYMEAEGLNRQTLANRLDVSPQYVSKLLSGKVNFSFKSVADIEEKLGLRLISVAEMV